MLPDDAMAWRVRVALRAQDWSLVRKDIEAMPEPMISSPEWIYWSGRSFKAQGRDSAAEDQFKRIAGQPNFYGVLATEELGRARQAPHSGGADHRRRDSCGRASTRYPPRAGHVPAGSTTGRGQRMELGAARNE